MEYSPTIYKYRTWTNKFHQNCLRRNELFYSSPSEINDPLDFKVTIDYTLLDSLIKREKYVDKLIAQTLPILLQRGINPIEKKKELMWRLANDADKMQEEFDRTDNLWTDNRFGVISFSQRWDSILMWSHYANNHRGFCIGYNRVKLENSELTGASGGVHYSDYFPRIDPVEDDHIKELVIKTHTKASEWSYEKEYRLTQLWTEGNPSTEDRTIRIPDSFFDEIIFGLCISDEDKNEIAHIAELKKIPVFAITRKRQSFILEKKRI